jgi:hypothetical protein
MELGWGGGLWGGVGLVYLVVPLLSKPERPGEVPAAHRAVERPSPMARYAAQNRPVAAGGVERVDVPHV